MLFVAVINEDILLSLIKSTLEVMGTKLTVLILLKKSIKLELMSFT